MTEVEYIQVRDDFELHLANLLNDYQVKCKQLQEIIQKIAEI